MEIKENQNFRNVPKFKFFRGSKDFRSWQQIDRNVGKNILLRESGFYIDPGSFFSGVHKGAGHVLREAR